MQQVTVKGGVQSARGWKVVSLLIFSGILAVLIIWTFQSDLTNKYQNVPAVVFEPMKKSSRDRTFTILNETPANSLFPNNESFALPNEYEINNYGNKRNILVRKDRYLNVSQSDLKTILLWNNAYGSKEYFFGHTREPFYENRCPETRYGILYYWKLWTIYCLVLLKYR